MDQVRNILRIIWQQRFWVLSGLGIIIAAVCWMMAAKKLDAEFATNQSAIKAQFDNMSKITKMSVLGNTEVNDHYRKEAMGIRDKVVELWKKLYDRQRSTVLKWPELLGDEFLSYVKDKKFRDPITSPDMQQVYREFAVDRFPALVEIVQARKMAEGTAGGFGDGGRPPQVTFRGDGGDAGGAAVQVDAQGNPLPEEKYLVEWLDQQNLRAQLDFANRPTSLQIWVTQEDLWVYETLLHCIANANEKQGATRPDNAAIRWIVNLDVGQKAAVASQVRGQLLLPASAAVVGEGEAGGPGAATRGGDSGIGGGTDGPGGAAGASADAGLLMYRYLDAEGKMIADAATDAASECRRLPVRMVLYMQQSAIPSILVECANAPLPIEVKRIRVNADKSGAGFTANFGPAVGGGGTDSRDGGGFGGGTMFRGGDGGRDGGTSMTPTEGASTVGLATVEFQGVVYIYNPPDPATLHIPGDENVAAAPATATAANP